MNKRLSHYDSAGRASIVDVSDKPITERSATARAFVAMTPKVVSALPNNRKGDPLEVARIAGICAAKKTADLIPLCHPLPLTHIAVEFRVNINGIEVEATARTAARTGVEMEAMTAAAIAALTIYDMTKGLDKGIEIRDIFLLEKRGGKSGFYRRRSGKKPEVRD
ncbi:MAG: cyclic pyranopterin monophosphate synthase MoaC [Acidobacteriaceae bacterium]|nr:cyclic pyranopterin monophosphate synthase MoaC [Acidobacteriaceae bacterium]MBV9781086.1 cyclic pyranopterin monophosphate synthase MoaC [Acidobacteriaceae bacterium]